MRKILWVLLAAIATIPSFAQGPPITKQIAQQYDTQPFVQAPTVANFSAAPAALGSATCYYWIVTQLTNPSATSVPLLLPLFICPTTTGGTAQNPVSLNWSLVPGATYDVLETTTSAMPTGTNTIAIATGLTVGNLIDSGQARSSYILIPAGLPFSITNKLVSGIPTLTFCYNGNCSFTINSNGVAGNALSTITNPGSFTNAPTNNEYLQALINNCNPSTEIQTVIGPLGSIDALAGCLKIPSTSTINLGNGIAGYVNNSSTSTTGEAVFGLARVTANNTTNTEALNGIIQDVVGLTGHIMEGSELDINVLGSPSVLKGLLITGASTGTIPTTSVGVSVSPPGIGKQWGAAISTGTGASNVGLGLGPQGSANSTPSQQIQMSSVNSVGTIITSIIQTDAAGQVNITPAAGQNFAIAGALGNTARTATMGLTLKTGSGAGNYTGTNITFTAVDTTNLCATFTVPTGWKLKIEVSGVLESVTAAVAQSIALADAGTTCAGGGISPFIGTERDITPPAAGIFNEQFHAQFILIGDGAAHSPLLIAKTSNAADAWGIQNPSTVTAPSLIFTLMPSN